MSEENVPTIENPKEEGIHLHYRKALLSRRIFAKVVDFFLAICFGIAFFLLARTIVTSTSSYQRQKNIVDSTMLDSGLYVKKDDEVYDVITYYENQDISGKDRMTIYENIISSFMDYAKSKKEENYDVVKENFDSYRLGLNYQDASLFVKDGDAVIKNPSFDVKDGYSVYAENAYKPYIDNQLRGYLLSLFPDYYSANRYMSRMILLVELPIAVLSASLLVFLVPPLIFRRNRQTIGMLIYHIGKADSSLLHLKIGKFLAYEAIYILFVIALSFATLGIPLLVSATMMVFTKNRQCFADYMLQLYDLDVSESKIYYSLEEIASEHASACQVNENFQMVPRNDE